MKPIFTLMVCLIAHLCYGQDYALDLDGQDDYVELSNFPNVTTNFTITAWIKTEERVSPLQRIFIDDRHESAGNGWGFSLSDGPYGTLNFYSRSTTPKILLSPDSMRLASGVWAFVTAVADITNHMKYIYINGELAVSGSFTGNWGIDTGKAAIGGININTPTGMEGAWFRGEIDNVIFWNKALTQAEIKNVMCSPADPSKPDILGIWRFNEGAGTTTADESGHGYNGVFFTSPYTQMPAWVQSTVPQDCSAYFPPKLTMADIQVTEGNTGTTNASFIISLDRPSPQPIIVPYYTSQENINNNDFIPTSGILTIPANTLQATINVPIIGDLTDEYPESFRMNLNVQSGADVINGSARCIIQDNDIPPGVRVNDTFALESSRKAVVRVSLTRASGKTTRVRFNTNNQTALARYDYLSQYQGTIVFAPGETSKYINVTLLADQVQEPVETFRFILYAAEKLRVDAPSGGKTIGIVSILDGNNAAIASSESVESFEDINSVIKISAAPNPSSGEFNVFIQGASQTPATLRVTDMLGRIVEAKSEIHVNGIQRLGAAWKPGVYFVQIIQENKKWTIRLVKTD